MIVEDKDLPEHLRNQQKLAHDISKKVFPQVWNISTEELHKIQPQIDGNSLLTYFSTILVHFAGRWIVEMYKVAQRDEAGVQMETLIKECLNGIIEIVGCPVIFEDEKKPLPDGIKPLRKQEK